MSSTNLQRVESPVFVATESGYQQSTRFTKEQLMRVASALWAKRNERYVMRGEDLLRGPMGAEFRRASWL
jgi:hypothetical protein